MKKQIIQMLSLFIVEYSANIKHFGFFIWKHHDDNVNM